MSGQPRRRAVNAASSPVEQHARVDGARTVWTVGHSTHPWEAFVAMLQAARITAVVDVRLLAGSRRHPQFNSDAMALALPQAGIRYVPMRDLGGRRRPRPDRKSVV